MNSSGRAVNIVHLETQPPEFEDMRDRVRRNLRNIVYRPRIQEGKMVMTSEMIFTHEFYYRPEDIPVEPEPTDSGSR